MCYAPLQIRWSFPRPSRTFSRHTATLASPFYQLRSGLFVPSFAGLIFFEAHPHLPSNIFMTPNGFYDSDLINFIMPLTIQYVSSQFTSFAFRTCCPFIPSFAFTCSFFVVFCGCCGYSRGRRQSAPSVSIEDTTCSKHDNVIKVFGCNVPAIMSMDL